MESDQCVIFNPACRLTFRRKCIGDTGMLALSRLEPILFEAEQLIATSQRADVSKRIAEADRAIKAHAMHLAARHRLQSELDNPE